MADYIDREALVERLTRNLNACNPGKFSERCYQDAINTVNFFSAVDVAPVVRCKDCKHCCLDLSGRENHLCMRKEVGFVVRRKANDFFSYGERKDNG